jgi:hypothetical protein
MRRPRWTFRHMAAGKLAFIENFRVHAQTLIMPPERRASHRDGMDEFSPVFMAQSRRGMWSEAADFQRFCGCCVNATKVPTGHTSGQ